MQDRFRYRVWDKTQNKWLHFDFSTYPTYQDRIWQALTDGETFYQCTGLKDKNGKLIYEGDIVRFIYGNKKRLGYVKENKTVWSITNSNFCQGAWCGGALINLYETCEVIGNRYENSELLED